MSDKVEKLTFIDEEKNLNNNVLSKKALNALNRMFDDVMTAKQPSPQMMTPNDLKMKSKIVPPGVSISQDYLNNDVTSAFAGVLSQTQQAMTKKLDDAILSSFGDYATVTANEPSLYDVMKIHDNQTVIKAFLNKIGRWAKDHEIKEILDYMVRKSTSLVYEGDPLKSEEDTLERLVEELEGLPGVKVNVLFNDFPTTASIIIKVNTNALDATEADFIASAISMKLEEHKPRSLEELEVIYHHKEMY